MQPLILPAKRGGRKRKIDICEVLIGPQTLLLEQREEPALGLSIIAAGSLLTANST